MASSRGCIVTALRSGRSQVSTFWRQPGHNEERSCTAGAPRAGAGRRHAARAGAIGRGVMLLRVSLRVDVCVFVVYTPTHRVVRTRVCTLCMSIVYKTVYIFETSGRCVFVETTAKPPSLLLAFTCGALLVLAQHLAQHRSNVVMPDCCSSAPEILWASAQARLIL